MAYELILPPDVQTEIRDYIFDRFATTEERLLVWDQIEAELAKLATNPALGTAPIGGPFEQRPIYRFSINVSGPIRYIQVVYKVHRQDGLVVILGFAPVQM